MTRNCLLLAALLTAFASGAAAQNCVPKAADYKNLPKTKTYVVLDDNAFSDYNMAIKKDMAKEWKVTEVAYIGRRRFEELRSDPNCTFLLTTTVTYPEDKIKDKYTYLSLLVGKPNVQIRNMPDLISIPLAYANITDQKFVYKLPAFIRFILAHVDKMTADPKLISETPLMMYNKNKKSLASKTLYLLKNEMAAELRSEAAIKKVYPYKFKFVGEDEIRKAIEEKRSDVVFLHKVGPENNKKTRCYKLIMGADDASVYYFDFHMINAGNPDCLRAKDLKSMAGQ